MYEIYRSVDFRKETENEYFDRITSLPKAESENNYRIEFIKKYLAGEPSSCFDIGCGGGVLIHSLSQEFKSSSFYGVEPTQNFFELTKKKTKALVTQGYFSKVVSQEKSLILSLAVRYLNTFQTLTNSR